MSEKQNEKCVTSWYINENNSTICIKINKTKNEKNIEKDCVIS